MGKYRETHSSNTRSLSSAACGFHASSDALLSAWRSRYRTEAMLIVKPKAFGFDCAISSGTSVSGAIVSGAIVYRALRARAARLIFAVNLASYVLVTCGSVLVMVTSTLPAVVIEFT